MDHFIFFSGGGGGGKYEKKKSCTMDHFIFEGGGLGKKRKQIPALLLQKKIKIVHSGTKQRNILQASEIKFIQSFQSRKNFLQEKIAGPPLKNMI